MTNKIKQILKIAYKKQLLVIDIDGTIKFSLDKMNTENEDFIPVVILGISCENYKDFEELVKRELITRIKCKSNDIKIKYISNIILEGIKN